MGGGVGAWRGVGRCEGGRVSGLEVVGGEGGKTAGGGVFTVDCG